ncbi:MAG: UvrD-helicase domain-containing protein [Prevotellaceae bacterium]|jgi:DNA helicase-2/ATP-dependent DNA helicase PcrA|nr:UvrD-helicase domain-containing protein [Prevotellaceae bacterium]
MSDFLSGLNGVQRDAVVNFQGPSLVIAGAGSGKTRVLTYRIAYMLSQGVKPYFVLALTFTNKAAKEMKERIAHVVGEENARQLWMGTFHSIFAKILRFEAEKIGFPSAFTIYDTSDSQSVIRAIVREMSLDENVYKVNQILSRISAAKNSLITPPTYAASAALMAADRQNRRDKIADIYATYARRCKTAGAMDFDDLLLYTNMLFRDHPEVLQKYGDKFKYILVDEYQDTNNAQYLIVKRLSEMNRNLCVVGDDAQSIYSFRGAKIENILNFKNDYPELKTFKLEQNYRSTQNIVNAANSVIEKNTNQLKKKCFSDGEEGEKIAVMQAFTDQEEGLHVAGDIHDTLYANHLAYSDFSILYRTNAQSRIFEDSLRRKNIPYKIYGGLSFYQRKEIKDLLSYLRLVVNHNDDEAFKRVVNYPKRGIGDTTMDRIEFAAAQNNMSLWDGILSLTPEQADIKGGTYKKLSDFILMIDSFSIKAKTDNAYDIAMAVAQQSGMYADLRSEKNMESIARVENFEELLNSIKEFSENYKEENGEEPLLASYLENVSLLTDADNEKPEERNSVSLMTVHSAKGLEYKYVYIVGMEENLFPSQMSMDLPQGLEEERRLFYVALTRAKVKVTLSFAQSRFKWGNHTSCTPSRFIKEIDARYVDLQEADDDISQYSQDPDDYFSPQAKTYTQKQTYDRQQYSNERSQRRLPYSAPAQQSQQEAPQYRQRSAAPVGNFKPMRKAGAGSFVASDAANIVVGAKVEHERFGAGQVLAVEGQNADMKATVAFAHAGQKTLLLKFAKLMVVK